MHNILYLGPVGTNSHMAAEEFVKKEKIKDAKLIPYGTIKSIIREIDQKPSLTAIVPIENSIEGVVRETLDNVIRTKDKSVVISKEIIFPIHHCLISKANDISTIKTIISHPQAIAQCQGFILKTFGDDIKIVNAPSTSDAVMSILEKDNTFAAIGNKKAAEFYGIPILFFNINDEDDNKTRFVYLSREISKPTGKDKTSIVFSTDNKPGALVRILDVFRQENVNLSYIDSRPSKIDLKEYGPYIFFADCEIHCSDEKFRRVIGKIKPFITFYRCIGAYSRC